MGKPNLKVVEPTTTQQETKVSNLESQLQVIEHRKKLADNRAVFILKKNSLQDFSKQIQTEIKGGNFEATKFKVTFSSGSYRDDEKLSITQTDLIQTFCDVLMSKIDENISKIETELLG